MGDQVQNKARSDRLAAALRANLRQRRAQKAMRAAAVVREAAPDEAAPELAAPVDAAPALDPELAAKAP